MLSLRLSCISALGVLGACSALVSGLRAQPAQPRAPTSVTSAGDTVRLQYVCGNAFRITHTRASLPDTQITTTWPGTGGATNVPLYKRLAGRTYTETVFNVPTGVDTVLINGFGASLRETHRHTAACAIPHDTTWATNNPRSLDYTHIDTTQRLGNSSPSDSVWGRAIDARAVAGVSRDSIARTLAKFGIRVSATTTYGHLYLRVDKKRNTYAAYIALVDSLALEPAFMVVAPSTVLSSLRNYVRRDGVERAGWHRENVLGTRRRPRD